MQTDLILAQSSAVFLLSWVKAILILLPFIPWAWLVSTKLEKDARYFHLNVKMWNGIYLASAAAALAVMLLIPGTVHIFWITWPLGILILAAPLMAYLHLRNQQVPESKRFTISAETLTSKLDARKQARASRDAAIQFTDASGKPRDMPLKEQPLHEVHMLAEDLIGPSLAARATRVELAVSPSGCVVSQTIDGVRYKREPFPVEAAIRLIDYLKDIAGLDVEDRRRQQAGDFKLSGPNGLVEVRAVTAGSSNSQLIRLEFDRANRLVKPFDALGLLPNQMEALSALDESHNRHGVVLIGAPSGHGLSTTAYSLLSRHDAYTSNIKTLEHDVEVLLDGVDHVEWDPTNPEIDYATNLQSILRRDPDIVLVSKDLDTDAARVVIEPGMQGPLIYVPLVSPSVAEQIRQWVKMVGDVKQAVKPLRIVMNQRLLRSLCPSCRQGYQPSTEQLRKLGLPEGKVSQLYRPSGKVQVKNRIENCPVCGGTGYLGQTGAFEVMTVDDEGRNILATGDLKAALAHARRNKMIYLQEAALSKVISGETSIEEVIRVTTGGKSEREQGK